MPDISNIFQFNQAFPSITGTTAPSTTPSPIEGTTAPSAAALEPDPWTGRWSTSNEGIGMIDLTQSGSTVIGTIGDGKYIFAGTVSGKELTAKWQEPETNFSGDVVFTLSKDGKSFSGKWKSSLSPEWQNITGKRQ